MFLYIPSFKKHCCKTLKLLMNQYSDLALQFILEPGTSLGWMESMIWQQAVPVPSCQTLLSPCLVMLLTHDRSSFLDSSPVQKELSSLLIIQILQNACYIQFRLYLTMIRLRHILKYCLTAQELSPKECYYRTLGLQTAADMDTIRQAYLEMVKKYHPDLNKDKNTTEVFTLVQKAYEVLSQQSSKDQYDKAMGYNKLSTSASSSSMDVEQAQEIMQKVRQKFLHGEQNRKKDLLNDDLNFSYKLYKTHFDKIQSKKPTYDKFYDPDGTYYEPKSYQNPPIYKSYMFALLPLAGVAGYFMYKYL